MSDRQVSNGACIECLRPRGIFPPPSGYTQETISVNYYRPITPAERDELKRRVEGWIDHTLRQWEKAGGIT